MSVDDPPSSLGPVELKPMAASSIRFGPLAVARFFVHCFSQSDIPRVPPSPEKTKHVRLITLAASHFCEKARWGLDLLELDSQSPIFYTEDAHAPPFHSFETLPASGYKSSVTPMLIFPGGPYLVKSDNILRSLCPFLYPKDIAARVHELEDDLGVRVGVTVRAIIYYNTLRSPFYPTIAEVLTKNTSKVETFLLNAMMEKGVAKAMKQGMHINKGTHDASLQTLRQVFAELSETLSDGREYLCDNSSKNETQHHEQNYGFTAADLTLAALSAPILQPDVYFNTFGVSEDKLPDELVELQRELRATKAGQHVLKMYQKHRPVVVGPSSTCVVVANGDEIDVSSCKIAIKTSGHRDQIAWSRLFQPLAGACLVVAGASLVAVAAANNWFQPGSKQ